MDFATTRMKTSQIATPVPIRNGTRLRAQTFALMVRGPSARFHQYSAHFATVLTYARTDKKAFGNEAIQRCADGKYCCNRERLQGDCCEKEDISVLGYFELPDGQAFATIMGEPSSPTASSMGPIPSSVGQATGGGGDNNPPPSPSSTSPPEESTSPPPEDLTTVTFASTTSDPTGGPVTVIQTQILTASPEISGGGGGDEPTNSNRTPLIIGCAVGIPVVLALAGAFFFLLRRQRQRKSAKGQPDFSEKAPHHGLSSDDDGLVPGAAAAGTSSTATPRRHGKTLSEIDGRPTNAARANAQELDSTPIVESASSHSPSSKPPPSSAGGSEPSPNPSVTPTTPTAPGSGISSFGPGNPPPYAYGAHWRTANPPHSTAHTTTTHTTTTNDTNDTNDNADAARHQQMTQLLQHSHLAPPPPPGSLGQQLGHARNSSASSLGLAPVREERDDASPPVRFSDGSVSRPFSWETEAAEAGIAPRQAGGDGGGVRR